MGKGDKKTKRGKIFMGSFGNTRRKKTSKSWTAQPSADAGNVTAVSEKKRGPRRKEK